MNKKRDFWNHPHPVIAGLTRQIERFGDAKRVNLLNDRSTPSRAGDGGSLSAMKTKGVRAFVVAALLLFGGTASAQVVINGNVYGGGLKGQFKTGSSAAGNTNVTINDGTVQGSVYGGGEGMLTDETAGLVEGNTTVTMTGGSVERSIYGGGELGNVGTYTETYTTPTGAHVLNEPMVCKPGTGLATVTMSGGNVGHDGSLMPNTSTQPDPDDDDRGWIFCGGRGDVDSITNPKANLLGIVGSTYLEISGGVITASAYGGSENGLTIGDTHVKITGGQIGTGLISKTTTNPPVGTFAPVYAQDKWDDAIAAVQGGDPTTINAIAAQFYECDAFPYGIDDDNDPATPKVYYVYDIYANQYTSNGGSLQGSNGHSFFGNVFGGGSGYYPIKAGVWRRSAGRVWGNTLVEIEGGHILTAVYGGNEITDVMGKCTVEMSGGTIGVPRTLTQIRNHPVTCGLYGGSMGDPRSQFNQWCTVNATEVTVTGGTIFGSVFGGGEDGHVLNNATVTIGETSGSGDAPLIGTWGYSRADGNVFGGGRGFSGLTIPAGAVCGNVQVNIHHGTILGSIYGGGRLASAGIGLSGTLDPTYGYFQQGTDHGYVTINIYGGTIGNDYESKLHLGNPELTRGRTYGGNVFGGSMGSLYQLDGTTINTLWPVLGQVKETEVNISGNNTIIKGSVFGGGELGLVLDNTNVNVSGGTIWRNVYGGGYGSDDYTTTTDVATGVSGVTFRYTPMAFAGVVSKKTNVKISGGWVKKNVYGGGELASVGLIDYSITGTGSSAQFINITKHTDVTSSFALSWPYDYQYFTGFVGQTNVEITGGRIGITGKDYMGPWNASGQPIYYDNEGTAHVYDLTDGGGNERDKLKEAREDNGDVYGGGHGIAGDRYNYAFCANTDQTAVSIKYPSSNEATPENYKPTLPIWDDETWRYAFYEKASDFTYTISGTSYGASLGCITGGLYGGGENGHVLTSTNVTLGDDSGKKGLVGHNLYGGGKGSDTYRGTLKHIEDNPGQWTQGQEYETDVPSITAGKVYGSTNITIYNGNVVRNVYGGGNQASVGKGNYGGGPTIYPYVGYGEAWTSENATELKGYLANSGHTYVNIYGGTIGTVKGMKDDLPTGNVFGGCRGTAAPNVALTPRIEYSPEFFLGYVNHTHVKIGQSVGTHTTPRLYGCVFGGGQDGHVRWQTDVVVNDGEIGNEYVNREAALALVGTNDLDNYQWLGRGSVYGAGMGLGKYKDVNGDEHYSPSAGSVTQLTNVTINGGTIHNEVYGGGPLATVGPPNMGQTTDAPLWNGTDGTLSKVTINSTVGVSTDVIGGTYEEEGVTKTYSYGGNVYGASRGLKSFMAASTFDEADFGKYATTVYSQVDLNTGAFVPGYVYGGGFLGQVKQNTDVNMIGGTVGTIAYTDANNDGTFDGVTHTSGGLVFGGGHGVLNKVEAARVKGNTDVTISGGHVLFNVYGGGELASVGLSESYTYTNGTSFTDLRPKKNAADQNTGVTYVTISGGQVGPEPRVGSGYNIPCGLNGTDGYVFGGGKGVSNDYITDPTHPYSGSYYNIADVNYTNVKVEMDEWDPDNNKYNRIWGSIFGGAEDGHVLGNAHTEYVSGLMGTQGTTSYDGNIFGGGRNYSKANYNAGRVRGNISVLMCGGQIYGSIFGGGRLALTGVDQYGNIIPDGAEEGAKYGNTYVKVNGGTIGNDNIVHDATLGDIPFINTFTTFPMGDVFGGGKGDKVGITGHPKASALLVSLVKNTEVVVADSIKDGNKVSSPKVLGSVFGGGEVATVGQFTWTLGTGTISDIAMVDGTGVAKVTVTGGQIGVDRMKMDYTLADGVGNYNLKYNTDLGHVFGGGEGRSDDPTTDGAADIDCIINGVHHSKYLLDLLATVGETDVTITNSVDNSGNEIGSAWVKGSVYGGSMSGHVMRDTKVTVSGGVVGAGKGTSADLKYEAGSTAGKLFNPLTTTAAFDETTGDVKSTFALPECEAWPYDSITCRPFDALRLKADATYTPSDGKTWFGNVFGGGSGYYPYYKMVGSEYKAYWNRDAGKVYGNATVIITGGHILTSVFGGGEINDVGHFTYDDEHGCPNGGTYVSGGVVSVTMSGGTLGVPRTFDQIDAHPVTCYLFGAGKGDQRVEFNTYTNVKQATAIVNGGTIYGSVFGGGEDGHVFEDAIVTISETDAPNKPTIIGTTGRSYVDGNVFGGGRGFSGEALTAGVVRGNVTMTIKGGTMLGSIYGGGRLAAVGTNLVPQTNTDKYGKMIADDGTTETHGHINITIGGSAQENHITIGNDWESYSHYSDHTTGGNVFAGGMGRINNLDGTPNTSWHQFGRVKNTTLTISQGNSKKTTIKGNVYGGGELGSVGGETTNIVDDHSTHVTISGGTLWRDVYGGGFGSDETGKKVSFNSAQVAPMQLAARVFGNTNVTVSGGWIKKCVYGGGELASVGHVTDSVKHTQGGSNAKDALYLSWPYEFTYAANTGTANVTINGGRIGVAGKDYLGPWGWDDVANAWKPIYYTGTTQNFYNLTDETSENGGVKALKKARKDNGDIYGGGKGKAGSTYVVAHLANVKETVVIINDATTSATPLTYKPYEPYATQIAAGTMSSKIDYIIDPLPNLEDFTYNVDGTPVNFGTKGCIAGAVYGGSEDGHVRDNTDITLTNGLIGHAMYGGGKGKGKYKPTPSSEEQYNPHSGKVYGNTTVKINGGYVVRNVFGGGNLASVGKGNYLGFGENSTDTDVLALATGSGKATVTINGGQLGMLYPSKPDDVFKDNVPYGSVFGGCRGMADTDTNPVNHRYGFVNETEVTIGSSVGNTSNPRIYGSVYGGGQDGHVRRSTDVTVNNGEIGVEYRNSTYAAGTSSVGVADLNSYHWTERGNVFGGGSGLGTTNEDWTFGTTQFDDETNHALLAGSVFATTQVEINGGRIHRNVYGGGNLAQVLGYANTTNTQTAGVNDKVTVKIQKSAKVGLESDLYDVTNNNYAFVYGGNVFGAGKGFASDNFQAFCNVINTDVTISSDTPADQGGNVYGDVYGGGENGHTTGNTDVKIKTGANVGILVEDTNHSPATFGGTTSYDGNVFGGGLGSGHTNTSGEFEIYAHCGRVDGNTKVTMDDGTLQGSIFGGGRLALVGVKADGSPYVTGQAYDSLVSATNTHGLAEIIVNGGSIGNPDGDKLLNGSDESVGDIFGSGKGDVKNYMNVLAGRVANSKITVSNSPRIYGSVFGGGEMAGIGYWREVSGKQKFYDKSGTSVVIIGTSSTDNPEIGTDTEFTSAYAATTPDWTVYDADGKLVHTCTGNVFGGAQGDVAPEKPHWVSMGRSRRAFVTINGGTIKSHVFGGGEQGAVTEDAKLLVNGGTIGTVMNSGTSNEYLFGGVFGGGYGSHRNDYNTNPANNDSTTALGATLSRPNYLAGRVYGDVYVNVLGGIIQGDVFGGASYAYIGGYGTSPKGNVHLNIGNSTQKDQPTIGTTIKGSVFGANNHSGTPYGDVYVDVYHTKHTETATHTNYAPSLTPPNEWTHEMLLKNIDGTTPFTKKQAYAIKEVFGGGNRASYTPNLTRGTRTSTVHIHYCENTIQYVYGGGNAADIGKADANANTDLTVDGGRFEYVFGGGNGTVSPASTYGLAKTTIDGGVIQYVFGGGNHDGSIFSTDLTFTHGTTSGFNCDEYIDEIYGGSNEAPAIGDIVTNLLCGDAGVHHEFYGGPNHAVVWGNVTLNVYGGEVHDLFGGSKGQLDDTSTSGIDESIAADIKKFPTLEEVTAHPENYSTELKAYLAANTSQYGQGGNVTVNLYGGKITNVFGGCDINGNVEGRIAVNVLDDENATCPLYITNIYGASRATPHAPNDPTLTSPIVNVVHFKEKNLAQGITGNVFGGSLGYNATVTANPIVNIGYNAATMDTYIPAAYLTKLTNATITPHVLIYGNVYGGGSEGKTVGNTTVNVYDGEIGRIGYTKKTHSTTPTVLDSIIHLEYDAVNHLVGGSVFGGGKGSTTVGQEDYGRVTKNSTVNISGGHVQYSVYGGGEMASVGQHNEVIVGTDVVDFTPIENTGLATVNITGGQVGPAPIKKNIISGDNDTIVSIGLNGLDGYVFGGGKGKGDDPIELPASPYGAYYKFANVNNTVVTVNITSTDTVKNRLWGSIFGGAEDGHVLGNARVNYVSGYLGTTGTTSYDGNIFGGGRNFAHKNYTAGRVAGNTTVEMTGGQLFGNIYGGGRLGVTGMSLIGIISSGGHYQAVQEGTNHGLAKVMVKGGTIGNNKPTSTGDLLIETFSEHSMGSVYGGGMGTLEGIDVTGHPKASSLIFGMTKNTEVEISGTTTGTHVYGIVFGGGEIANVGKFTWDQTGTTISNVDVHEGKAKVTITGGTIGADRAKMRYEAGDAPYQMYPKYNDDLGYVYGGGEGYSDDPTNTTLYPVVNTAFGDLSLLDLMSSVYETEVNISGGWVKASVFGGSESGHVMSNTKVTISGGQIGAGHNYDPMDPDDKLYVNDDFINPLTQTIPSNMYGTYHWKFASPYNPYDPASIANSNSYKPTDGKSWFGNVFGGGSGWFPYIKNVGTTSSPNFVSYWNPISGKVWGNTQVIITGGHILNNVYGGNESTDVGGKATVKMSGGTVGVPRIMDSIKARPLSGYVFGGGCGDPRTVFDAITVVDSTHVRITGGIIYGSVYGGAEDGHVLGDTRVFVKDTTILGTNISPIIGCRGTSDADGNVFGGGRNYLGGINNNKKAGRVEGNTYVTITGGTTLGSVFGGGRMAQTGVRQDGEYNTDDHAKGKTTVNIGGTAKIGNGDSDYAAILYDSDESIADVYGGGKGDYRNATVVWAGRVTNSVVNITGTPRIYGSVWGGGEMAGVGYPDGSNKIYANTGESQVNISGGTIGTDREYTKEYMDSPGSYTTYEDINGVMRLLHTCTGNVFGGSRGEARTSTAPDPTYPHWVSMGRSRTATVTISGGTIKSSVYGGPEQGFMIGDASVNISGGTIGQEALVASNNTTYSFGSVFGGGYGADDVTPHTNDSSNVVAGDIAGRVYGNATILMTGGQVYGNVFGGGEVASVGYYTYTKDGSGNITNVACSSGGTTSVTVNGGIVGPLNYTGLNAYVFGGPKGGQNSDMRPYCNVNNTSVTVDYTTSATNRIWGSLFGGGSDGHVLGNTSVTLTDGTVGTDGTTGYDGNIFGAGRNYHERSLSAGRVQGNVTVTMNGGELTGSIFGGGRQGLTGVDLNGEPITTNGNITVLVEGGTVGTTAENDRIGHVFGGGKGKSNTSTEVFDHKRLGETRSTSVTIGGGSTTATVNGSVYGGSENGRVLENATVTIATNATIGFANTELQGDVYGGGRGKDKDQNPAHLDENNPQAGRLLGTARVNVNGGTVKGDVFGGGDQGIVEQHRIVNISGGEVQNDVYGGSHIIRVTSGETAHGKLKTVNVRGGHIMGHVYGSSFEADEGLAPDNYSAWTTDPKWSSFVNITGGQIDHDVYGAGYRGWVKGSTCVNIGLLAVQPTVNTNIASTSSIVGNVDYKDGLSSEPTPAIINILGSVYDGSNYAGSGAVDAWNTYDINGYSYTFIDGNGYNTTNNDGTYMNIGGGLYGCGTHCESGKYGRTILIRNYGTRTTNSGGDMTGASRTLTTIQRGGNVILDNANIKTTGAPDISGKYPARHFGVLQVDNGFYATNASGLVLGTSTVPTYMDSIHEVRSLYLRSSVPTGKTTYDYIGAMSNADYWEMVGIKDNTATPGLYRTVSYPSDALDKDEENVIVFNNDSRMWVRYYENSSHKVKYGQLYGFFRMSIDPDFFQPDGMESFAYARPKLTNKVNPIPGYNTTGNTWNKGDGGFLSYDNTQNTFTKLNQVVLGYTYTEDGNDGGSTFTNTKQYPYYNVSKVSKDDYELNTEEYREWILPKYDGQMWYVDGRGIGTTTGGWGKDENHAYYDSGTSSYKKSWGHFPDKPKKTLTGTRIVGENTIGVGVCNDKTDGGVSIPLFNPAKDIIFVVGPINASLEQEILNLSMQEIDPDNRHELKLFRYPGGHPMSNGETDNYVSSEGTNSNIPTNESTYDGLGSGITKGPGANLGMIINANKTGNFVMNNVIVDGLYGVNDPQYGIPSTFAAEQVKVSEPMVVTTSGAQLTLKGGTVLQHGYNSIDASGTNIETQKNYYLNPDFVGTMTHNGGALFVHQNATVNVEGLVTITGNLQKNGSGTPIASNVYLPTFAKSLTISGALDAASIIGITNPIRNTQTNYVYNTFSPVAVAADATNAVDTARTAWRNNIFRDDLGWFFVNGYTSGVGGNNRSTYYATSIADHPGFIEEANITVEPAKTLFFGWTWANVVRTAPAGYNDAGTTVVIDSKEDLAWLASTVNGMNKQTGASLTGKTVKQTKDFDMQQYVWVPVGSSDSKPFSGTYDGSGHLIENLSIDYIGKGSRIYEYNNFGMFGWVTSGTIDRTFVVSGINRPVGTVNIGGLVGTLGSSTLKNSEAAVHIVCPSFTGSTENWFAGGLVGDIDASTIHSSMAMPHMECTGDYDYVGGLLGGTTGSGTSNVHNSFANAKFTLGSSTSFDGAGGLVGYAGNLNLENCYIHLYRMGNLYEGGSAGKKFGMLASGGSSSTIKNCFVYSKEDNDTITVPNYSFAYNSAGLTISNCAEYSTVDNSDTYGYLYSDNYIENGDVKKALTTCLNDYVENSGGFGGDMQYARWTRPTIDGINGDLPVLLLSNYGLNGSGEPLKTAIGLGGFRNMSTYGGGPVLQYGGPIRDVTSAKDTPGEIDEAISRLTTTDNELFVYGDITVLVTATPITGSKISIYENAAILYPGTLSSFDFNYVGVTFDNTSRAAVDAYGNPLGRDWHMFGSPLSDAPLGMNYVRNGHNENTEGKWVDVGSSSNLYVYTPSVWNIGNVDANLPVYGFTTATPTVGDGYFPSTPVATNPGFTIPNGGAYGYEYDFYTWYEPDWQWINFKRNGVSHWHYDEKPGTTTHFHINYKATPSATANINEDHFIPGKGYMMAIQDNTYLQSHGMLNGGDFDFTITNSVNDGQHNWTWVPEDHGYFGNNFVGNPYHAYLDFDKFGGPTASLGNNIPSYYIYDADKGGYRTYTIGSSKGGEYASQYLHPHQGFFLKTADASKTITFRNNNTTNFVVSRSTAESSPFRDWRPNYPLVNLFAYDSEGRNDVVVIEFNRPENGGGEKVKTLRNGNHLIYAHNGDTDYGAFFAVEGTSRVPVRFMSLESEQKPYTLRWNTQNGFFNSLYLIDNLLGITYDMLANDSYTFVGSKEDYVSRFVIVFNVTDVEENTDPKTFAFYDGNTWVVNGTGRLEVIDVTGRILYTEDLHNEQNHINLNRYAKGVYMLRLWKHDKACIQKIVKY